jgi:O-acetylserine/cysteine efflux transporter
VLFAKAPRTAWRWVFAGGATVAVAQYGLLLLGMRAGPASLVIQVQRGLHRGLRGAAAR